MKYADEGTGSALGALPTLSWPQSRFVIWPGQTKVPNRLIVGPAKRRTSCERSGRDFDQSGRRLDGECQDRLDAPPAHGRAQSASARSAWVPPLSGIGGRVFGPRWKMPDSGNQAFPRDVTPRAECRTGRRANGGPEQIPSSPAQTRARDP